MKKTHWITALLFLLLLWPVVVISQGQYPDSEQVQLTAADGLTLVGDYFAPVNAPQDGAFAILFIHEHGGARGDVAFLTRPFIDQGYALLAVDLRGHGATGGPEDWEAVTGDLQGWMDWLQSQPGIRPSGGLMTVGVAVGGDYALIACANAAECQAAVAISPIAVGCEVVSCAEEVNSTSREQLLIDATTTSAIRDGLRRRSVLLIFSQEGFTSDSAKYLLAAQVEMSRRICSSVHDSAWTSSDLAARKFRTRCCVAESADGLMRKRQTHLVF
ncbi:MAG: alpha/beta hydrolase [Chloroflexi bacterium]|uniref:alpha/beta hydrolase n=1 Tax=Candidatus Flexifilum breve TaxID=3140694 RepID=UPI003136FBC1|nr:alpha/beta hydrolase [Chloroflexota bacterium]